ncbi:MAG: hypothetical protein NVS9B8_00870 [Candidatus Limnocylindrales bacterium]
MQPASAKEREDSGDQDGGKGKRVLDDAHRAILGIGFCCRDGRVQHQSSLLWWFVAEEERRVTNAGLSIGGGWSQQRVRRRSRPITLIAPAIELRLRGARPVGSLQHPRRVRVR